METTKSSLISEREVIKNLISDFPTIPMERIKFIEKRLYVEYNPFRVYCGITGALEASTFKGDVEAKRLGKWRDAMRKELGSQERQEAYLQMMADFGTLTHQCLVRIKENGKLDWKEEQDYAFDYFNQSAIKNGITPNYNVTRKQVFDYCKAAAALLQFVYDNVVKIYSIEGMCKDDELELATPLDLVCRVKDKKTEIDVSLNIKTSEQFSNSHRKQVALEKHLWNKTYPDLQVAKTGLLRGKDWSQKKGIPTYEWELLDEADEQNLLSNTLNRLRICKADENATYINYEREVPVFAGVTVAGESPKIEMKTLEQLLTEMELVRELA